MPITLRDVLIAYAEENGLLQPLPIRITTTNPNNGEINYTNAEGSTSYLISWGETTTPTQAELDAFLSTVAGQAITGEVDENSTDEGTLEPRVSAVEALLSSIATTVANLLTRSPEVQVTEFPASPAPYQKVIRSDLSSTTWTWMPDAGSSGEWWGTTWSKGCGSGAVNNNGYSRSFNGNLMSATAGIGLYERCRILTFDGQWSVNRTGSWQLRENGVADGRVIPVTESSNRIFFRPPTTSDTWLMGENNADILRVLGVYWGGADGNAPSHRSEILAVLVRYPGE